MKAAARSLILACGLLGAAVAVAAETAPSVISAAAYAGLMAENQTLRQRLDQLAADKAAAEAAQALLARQLTDMERRLASLVQDTERVREVPQDDSAGEVASLRHALAVNEQDRLRLFREVERLREAERVWKAQAAAQDQKPVDTGSDLFGNLNREIIQINELLARTRGELIDVRRQRDTAFELLEEAMLRIESQSREAARVRDESMEARQRAAEERRLYIAEYEKRVTLMEAETQRLQTALRERAEAIALLEGELGSLRRNAGTAPAAAAYAGTRVSAGSGRPDDGGHLPPALRRRRDMHYNLGVLAADRDRLDEAEREYLAALAIDPADAETHYNLGVLYENRFKDSRRALRHYRSYLAQRPESARAAAVKSWIMTIETREATGAGAAFLRWRR